MGEGSFLGGIIYQLRVQITERQGLPGHRKGRIALGNPAFPRSVFLRLAAAAEAEQRCPKEAKEAGARLRNCLLIELEAVQE
ncbi:MAG: hypothetical protein ACI8XO_005144, partial [Verrucomicrobiales bacterium]